MKTSYFFGSRLKTGTQALSNSIALLKRRFTCEYLVVQSAIKHK